VSFGDDLNDSPSRTQMNGGAHDSGTTSASVERFLGEAWGKCLRPHVDHATKM
jgi:hypothetical protein